MSHFLLHMSVMLGIVGLVCYLKSSRCSCILQTFTFDLMSPIKSTFYTLSLYREDQFEFNPSAILLKYLNTYFILDFLATFPIDYALLPFGFQQQVIAFLRVYIYIYIIIYNILNRYYEFFVCIAWVA